MGVMFPKEGRYLVLHNEQTGEDVVIDKVEARHRRLSCGFMNYLKLHACFLKHIILTQTYEQYKPKHINDFMNKMRRYYGKLHYMWTVELQMERLEKTGEAVLHWHILCGFPEGTWIGKEDILRIQKYWKYGDERNSVEIRKVKSPSVQYLMKYITKALDCAIMMQYKLRRIGSSRIPGYLRQGWGKVVRIMQHFACGGVGVEGLSDFCWQNGNAYLWEDCSVGGFEVRVKKWLYRKPLSGYFVVASYDSMPF